MRAALRARWLCECVRVGMCSISRLVLCVYVCVRVCVCVLRYEPAVVIQAAAALDADQ